VKFGANPFSRSRDFEAKTNKKVTDGAKTEPYVRAVIIILLQHFTVA